MKEKLKFHDKENKLFTLEIEIEDGKLSICGEGGSSCGQCQDSIKPANKEQRRLVKIWNTWHLNDMKAGTEKQEKALKEWRAKNKIEGWDFKEAVKFLKSKKLYTDKGYRYGSAWLKRELPPSLPDELKVLCNTIREQEAKRKTELEGGEFSEGTPNEIKALAKSLEISPKEAEEDITEESDNCFDYCGITYFVGTEEEATEKARNYLDEDLWKQAVANDNTTESFEDWQECVINIDGFGSILNSWDGSEDTQEIDGTTYYVIRMG